MTSASFGVADTRELRRGLSQQDTRVKPAINRRSCYAACTRVIQKGRKRKWARENTGWDVQAALKLYDSGAALAGLRTDAICPC